MKTDRNVVLVGKVANAQRLGGLIEFMRSLLDRVEFIYLMGGRYRKKQLGPLYYQQEGVAYTTGGWKRLRRGS